jgi:co-chaperonin GroES (HSP10)
MSTSDNPDSNYLGIKVESFSHPVIESNSEPLHPIEWAKPEYGYKPQPLLDGVFVKPVPKEHKSRLIVPDAYGTATDQGFVVAVGPKVEGIKAGDLVLFDRFAKVGYEFELLDEDGEVVPMVRLAVPFVFAVLERVKL